MKKSVTKKLVLSALFTALTAIATTFLRVPLPLGYVNLGDAFVLLAAFILGPLYGGVAAGLGSALADLFGYVTYAPGTLVIKASMAIVAYALYALLKKKTKTAFWAELTGGVVGAVVMSCGYFIYETLFFETVSVAALNLPWNLLQGVIGAILSVSVMRILTATKYLEKLQR